MIRRRWLWAVPLALVVAYGRGFVWFLRMTGESPDLPARADAIVVLTGGPERIETGLRLLAAGHAANLLISGLGSGATLQDVARRAGMDPAALAGRVILGRSATTTLTNATETARFVGERAIRNLILVTAGYHMPRALAELRRQMPGVVIYPAPVLPAPLLSGRGAARTPSWRLLMEEYTKWLIAAAGLSRYGPAHPSGQNSSGQNSSGQNPLGQGGAFMIRDRSPA